MPAQANANVIALQLEKVRDKVPLLYERDDILLTMIQQRGDVEQVSSRAGYVYVGQTVQVYDTRLTANRGTCNVTAADPINAQTITVDVVPTGTVATDVIVHDGLSGAQPVSLFGIKYHQNAATTGTWLNLNRATYPVQLQTPRVNAGNPALPPSHVPLANNKVRKSLGINHVAKLIAYMAVEQEHAWENLGITVSQIIKEGGSRDRKSVV